MLGHGAGISYTGSRWAPLTISVWWWGRASGWLHSAVTTMHVPSMCC